MKLFTTYVRTVWLIQAVTQCYGGSTVGGFFANANLILMLTILLAAHSRDESHKQKQYFVLATLARLGLRLASLPFLWEVEVWAIIMDVTLLAAQLDVSRAAPAIRAQMIVFYAGAAFWKINSSFLDSSTSCGTVFFAQLLTAYGPVWLAEAPATAAFLRVCAPASALAVELAVPLLLAVHRRSGLALGAQPPGIEPRGRRCRASLAPARVGRPPGV